MSLHAKSYPELQKSLEAGLAAYAGAMPGLMRQFTGIIEEATSPGLLDAKMKELIALAIAAVVRCDPCIAHHVRSVRSVGAGRGEVAEALGIAVLMGGGPALAYSVAAMEAFDQFAAEEGA